jgi:hypothetical protein
MCVVCHVIRDEGSTHKECFSIIHIELNNFYNLHGKYSSFEQILANICHPMTFPRALAREVHAGSKALLPPVDLYLSLTH